MLIDNRRYFQHRYFMKYIVSNITPIESQLKAGEIHNSILTGGCYWDQLILWEKDKERLLMIRCEGQKAPLPLCKDTSVSSSWKGRNI